MTIPFSQTASWALIYRLGVALASATLFACDTGPTVNDCCEPVALTLSPLSGLSLAAGEEQPVFAWTVDRNGRQTSAFPLWSTADPTVAIVRQLDGVVTGISSGTTQLNASLDGFSATTTITVRPNRPAARITLSSSSVNLLTGDYAQLSAKAVDSVGLPMFPAFEWTSADPTIASVGSTNGLVTGLSDGRTTVTVVSGAARATIDVYVIEPASGFSFTRITSLGGGDRYSADVLSYSFSDRSVLSLPRDEGFPWLASPEWSPDGSRLAVEVVRSFSDYEGFAYTSDLYVLNPATSSWRGLTANSVSSSPSWSPDGTRIAYVQQDRSGRSIYVADLDGGTPVRLTQPDGWYGKPRWSPDGTQLVFSAWLGPYAQSRLYMVNADGSGFIGVPTGENSYDPAWSPDGSQLVFVRFRDINPGINHDSFYDLVVSDTRGANERILTTLHWTSVPSSPTWSPDGRQILFSAGKAIHLLKVDGSGVVQLTTPPPNATDGTPTWMR